MNEEHALACARSKGFNLQHRDRGGREREKKGEREKRKKEKFCQTPWYVVAKPKTHAVQTLRQKDLDSKAS